MENNKQNIDKIIANSSKVIEVGPSKSRKLLKYAFLIIPFLGGVGLNQAYKAYQEQNKQEIVQQREIEKSEELINNVKQYVNTSISVFVAKDGNGVFSVKQAVSKWSKAGAGPQTIELGLKSLKEMSEFTQKSPESITVEDKIKVRNAITSFGLLQVYEPALTSEIFHIPTSKEKAQLRDMVQKYKADPDLKFNFESSQKQEYKSLAERRVENTSPKPSYQNNSTFKL